MLTVGVVLAAVGGATYSYFSDTETSSGNTFSAGTIDISVDDLNPWNNVGHFTIEDMKPSDVHYKEVTLRNEGVNTADIWKKITVDDYTGGLHPESELGEDPNNTDNKIGTVIRYDMSLNGWVLIEEADGYVMDEDDGTHQPGGTYHINGRYIYLGRLEPGAIMVVEQSYHMDGSTTNWAQGDTMDFSVEFYAQQTSGGAGVPGTELPGHGREGTELDSIDIGDDSDMTAHNAAGWLPFVKGGYGGGEGAYSFSMVWGDGGFCNATNDDATFELDAGSNTATKLVIRHLDGISDDSFEVFVDGVSVGSYANQYHSEDPSHWISTEFPVSFTGKKEVQIVATDSAGYLCAYGSSGADYWYGQVAVSWAKITD